jgi:hypothetical protein
VWAWDGSSWVGVRQETGIQKSNIWAKQNLLIPKRGFGLNSGYNGTTDQRRTKAGTIPILKHYMERDLGFFESNWTPEQISTVFWLDAAQSSTLTISTGVSTCAASYPGTGTAWTDLSGNGNNGTLTNGPTYSSANGGSIGFDGTNDYVSLGSKSFMTSNTFTFETVIKFDVLSTASYYTIFSYGGFISGGWLFQRPGEGINPIRFAFNGTNFYDTTTAFTTTGAWGHLIVSVSSGIPQAVYINNVSSAVTGSGTLSITNPKTVEIGRRADSSTQYIDASIGLVRIYSGVAFSATQVAQNYNAIKDRFGL